MRIAVVRGAFSGCSSGRSPSLCKYSSIAPSVAPGAAILELDRFVDTGLVRGLSPGSGSPGIEVFRLRVILYCLMTAMIDCQVQAGVAQCLAAGPLPLRRDDTDPDRAMGELLGFVAARGKAA
jgi:hypothetical protein